MSKRRIEIKIGGSGDLSFAPWTPKELEKLAIDAKNIISMFNFHVEEGRQRYISQRSSHHVVHALWDTLVLQRFLVEEG